LIGADDEMVQTVLAQIIEENWSARRVEQFVTDGKSKDPAASKPRVLPPQLNKKLSDKLAAKVTVQENEKGRGRIVIEFKNSDERRRIEASLEG
jgi:hypothetical protein